jgi:hypothetical protein
MPPAMTLSLSARVPWIPSSSTASATPSRIGDAAWVAFVLAQFADLVLTYVGITAFGPGIEANPLMAWCMAGAGVGLALVGFKVLALGCGTLLHVQGMHRSIAVLTTFYVGAAVWRWILLLWPGLF